MRRNPTTPLINQLHGVEAGLPASTTLFRKDLEGKQVDYTKQPYASVNVIGKPIAKFDKVGWKSKKTETKDAGNHGLPDCPWCKPEPMKR